MNNPLIVIEGYKDTEQHYKLGKKLATMLGNQGYVQNTGRLEATEMLDDPAGRFRFLIRKDMELDEQLAQKLRNGPAVVSRYFLMDKASHEVLSGETLKLPLDARKRLYVPNFEFLLIEDPEIVKKEMLRHRKSFAGTNDLAHQVKTIERVEHYLAGLQIPYLKIDTTGKTPDQIAGLAFEQLVARGVLEQRAARLETRLGQFSTMLDELCEER